MEVATVPLALDDLVPVLLAGAGALLLAAVVDRDAPDRAPAARAGALLILAGGLCKAGWKVVGVLSGLIAARTAKKTLDKTWTKTRGGEPPRNPAAHALLGFLFSAENKINQAKDAFENAMAIDGALGDGGESGGEQLFGGGEQVGAFAGALFGQGRVTAGDQSLVGVVGVAWQSPETVETSIL